PRCAPSRQPPPHPPDPPPRRDYQHRSEHENPPPRGPLGALFEKWEALLNLAIAGYVRCLGVAMRFRWLVVGAAVVLLAATILAFGSRLRREFFPEADAGAFEMYVRARSGTRIEDTEKRVADVEKVVKADLGGDLELVISEIGVVADWSAAYTPNSGPMDAVVKVQLKHDRKRSAQECVQLLR